MLKSLSISRYKSITQDIQFDNKGNYVIQGPIGSGKTAIVESLNILRESVINKRVPVDINYAYINGIKKSNFGVTIELNNTKYRYEIDININTGFVFREELNINGILVFNVTNKVITLGYSLRALRGKDAQRLLIYLEDFNYISNKTVYWSNTLLGYIGELFRYSTTQELCEIANLYVWFLDNLIIVGNKDREKVFNVEIDEIVEKLQQTDTKLKDVYKYKIDINSLPKYRNVQHMLSLNMERKQSYGIKVEDRFYFVSKDGDLYSLRTPYIRYTKRELNFILTLLHIMDNKNKEVLIFDDILDCVDKSILQLVPKELSLIYTECIDGKDMKVVCVAE